MPQRLIFLIVAVVTVLTYLPGLFNGFVWLDHGEIENHSLLVEDIRDIPRIFLHDRNYEGYHRPVYNLLHSLDASLWGMNPFGFHLSSLILHLLNVFLVSRVVSQYSSSMMTTWVITLLWSLHPVNSTVVGLIHAKADLFVVTTLLIAYLLIKTPFTTRRAQAVGAVSSFFFFTVALLTKETTFLYPVMIAATCVFPQRQPKTDHHHMRYMRIYLTGIVMIAAIVVCLRFYNTPIGIYTSKCGVVERLLTFCGVYNHYVFTLFFPVNLSICDTVTRFSALPLLNQVESVMIFCLLIGGQCVISFRTQRVKRWIVLYNVALLPVAQVIPILHFKADRFLYLSSLAYVAIVVECVVMLLTYRES